MGYVLGGVDTNLQIAGTPVPLRPESAVCFRPELIPHAIRQVKNDRVFWSVTVTF